MGSAIGGKNVIEHTNPVVRHDYGAVAFTAGLQRHFYRYGKVAAGTDVTYDQGAGARVDIIEGSAVQWRPGTGERFAVGLYGGYEHVIDRFGALVQAGYHAARGFEDPTPPRFYARYGGDITSTIASGGCLPFARLRAGEPTSSSSAQATES